MSKDILAQHLAEDDGYAAILAIANARHASPQLHTRATHSAEDYARYVIAHRANPRPVFSDDEVLGWMLDSLIMVCDSVEELYFRLTQLALARSETIAYSKGL